MTCPSDIPSAPPSRRLAAQSPFHGMGRLSRRAAVAVSACLALGAGHAQEAPVRDFPEAALRGRLEVTRPPEALLDGQPVRLAPGVRIRSAANLLVTSATLVGARHTVNYARDAAGELQYVWLLTDAEAALPRASADRGGILSWFGF